MDDISYILTKQEHNDIYHDIMSSEPILAQSRLTLENIDEIDDNSFKIVAKLTGYDLATESNDIAIYKSRLTDIQDSLSNIATKRFKKFQPLVNKIDEYNISKLEELKNKIEKGMLVPRATLDPKKVESLNKKLSVFYATGYDLNNAKGIISYINGLVGMAKRGSAYFKGLDKTLDRLLVYKSESEIKKLSGLLNVKYSLNGVNATVNNKIIITDYRVSIINKWIANRVELVVIKYSMRTGLKVSTEIYTNDVNKRIGIPTNKELLNLIEVGIQNKDKLTNAYSGISRMIKLWSKKRMANILKVNDNSNRFLVAKFIEKSIYSFINMYDDLASMDDLIIQYINLVTETPKKT